MKRVKKQTHKHASSKKHTTKKTTFWFLRYKWFVLLGLFIILGASFLTIRYITKGAVLSAYIGPVGGGCEAYCNGKQYCNTKSVRGVCSTTGCLFVYGKCGYQRPTPKPTSKPKPKPTPKDTRLQPLKCTSQTYPYQIFGPSTLAGGFDSTPTSLNGKITASICTQELYVKQYGKYAVWITTNIVFDKLAINAGVTCDGPVYPYPISEHGTYMDSHKIYPPVGQGALVGYYLNYKSGSSNPTTPDDRVTVSCPGGRQIATHQLAFQFSPDVFFLNDIATSKGTKYTGRLVFTLNFHQYGYPKDVDLWTNTITVK